MEALIALVVLGLVGLFLVAPIAAVVVAINAGRRAKALEERVFGLEQHLRQLERWASTRRVEEQAVAERRAKERVEEPPVGAASPEKQAEERPVPSHAEEPRPEPPPQAAPQPEPPAQPEALAEPSPQPQPSSLPQPQLQPSPLPQPSPEPSPLPQPSPLPRPVDVPVSAHAASLEEKLALTWLTRVGAAAFLLGALFFFKYAVDNEWIGPTGRVAIGVFTGLASLGVAEILRPKTRASFVHALSGIGLATIVASIWASVALYKLVPNVAAFVAAAVVLGLGAALALRHRAESLLVLVLLAGFLNPVVLSTGKDNPLALFGYLLLITSVTLAVAMRASFRVVPALAVPGVCVLFLGWYAKYFDAHPAVAEWIDLPPDQRAGPYFDLASRFVPLAAVTLFSAQWGAVAAWIHAREDRPLAKKLFALAALVLAHVGAAMLLFDHASVLVIVAMALGPLGFVLLSRISAKELLAIPMIAAFLAFAVVSGGVPTDERLKVVALLGGWSLVYVAAFLRDVARRAPMPRVAAISSAVAAGLFQILATVLLLKQHPTLLVLLIAAAGGVSAWVAALSRSSLIHLGAVVLSSILVEVAAAFVLPIDGATHDAKFLAALAVFAAVHLLAVAREALREEAPVAWGSFLTASITSIAFVSAVLLSTTTEVPTMRALLTAAVGALDLGIAALCVSRSSSSAGRSTLLAGLALGLFATAIAFASTGATITVLWGALVCVAAAIWARSKHEGWLYVTALLSLAAIVRLLFVDVPATQALVAQFFETHGRAGVYAAPILRSPRATSLAGLSVAMLLASWLLSDRASTKEQRDEQTIASGIFAIAGHALWIALAITEVRSGALKLPAPPPVPLDNGEWEVFYSHYQTVLSAQQGRLAMTTTLVLSASAALLLTLGFVVRSALHRYLGLALFFVAVLKLAFFDVWAVERLYQIILLTGVGVLLVAGGFLYARYSDRLLALMRTGSRASKPPPPAAAVLALLLLAPRAEAQELTKPLPVNTFTSMRVLSGIAAPGDHRLTVDETLYRASTSAELLADVRITGPDGRAVPYVIRPVAAEKPVDEVPGELTDPRFLTGGDVVATFRLPKGTVHCQVRLDITGKSFLRKTRIETGEDPESTGTVAEGPYVYRVEQQGVSVEHLQIPYPRSEAPIVRVRLFSSPELDVEGHRLQIRGGTFGCAKPPGANPVFEVPLTLSEVSRDEQGRRTIVTLDAGAEGLPVQAISLDVTTPELHRRVEVLATSFREVWPLVGGGMLYRIKPRPGIILESMRLPIMETRKRYFQLAIYDEDSAPLSIASARAEIRARELIFRPTLAGEHHLYVGDKMATTPRYDLAEILGRAERAEGPVEAQMGPVVPNPEFGLEEHKALPVTERYRGPIAIGMVVVLLGLSAWAVRILRRSEES